MSEMLLRHKAPSYMSSIHQDRTGRTVHANTSEVTRALAPLTHNEH